VRHRWSHGKPTYSARKSLARFSAAIPLPLRPLCPKLQSFGRLVQRLEQCPYKAKVGGSIPSPPIKPETAQSYDDTGKPLVAARQRIHAIRVKSIQRFLALGLRRVPGCSFRSNQELPSHPSRSLRQRPQCLRALPSLRFLARCFVLRKPFAIVVRM
jgi:hypothetical protein